MGTSNRPCSVEGCTRKHNSHGLCAMHGMRLARYGDVHNPGAFTYSETGLCTVAGCDGKHKARGYCGMHYQRHQKGRLALPDTLTCHRCDTGFPRPYKGNPDVIRFCSHECRYADQLDGHRLNQAQRTAYLREWRKRNPHLFKETLLRREAAKRGHDVRTVTARDLARLIRRHGGRCAYCHIRPYQHMDHVVPLKLGGRHAIGNLLPACRDCNLTKGAKLVSEWRLRRPVPRRFRSTKRAVRRRIGATLPAGQAAPT